MLKDVNLSQHETYKPISSPFKWAGGKSRLRKYIVSLVPPHSCYVEPFCGAAWVLFGKRRSDVEVINDIDDELITFFRVVKEQPEQLLESFEFTLVARSEYERLASLDPHRLSDLERAHRFYYLIMAGWGGESNYPRFQTSISDGGHGNRLIGAMKRLHERILPVYQRLQTVIIENLPWQQCIDKYDRPQTLFYIDPPYPGNGVNYKHNMRSWTDHQELAARLASTKAKWIVSSYDTPEVRSLFDGSNFLAVKAYSGMKAKKNGTERVLNEEVLVTNFPIDSSLSLFAQNLDNDDPELADE